MISQRLPIRWFSRFLQGRYTTPLVQPMFDTLDTLSHVLSGSVFGGFGKLLVSGTNCPLRSSNSSVNRERPLAQLVFVIHFHFEETKKCTKSFIPYLSLSNASS